MVGDDAVVMRIVIQDDGKPLPPGSDATHGGSQGGGHFTPSTAVHPQAQVGQPGGASQTTGFAGPSAGAGVRSEFETARGGQRASSGNAWVDAAARRAGIDPELLKMMRSVGGAGVPSAVRSAEPTVTVNEPAGPRINQPVTGGRVPGATGGAYAAGAGAGPEPMPSVTAAGEGLLGRGRDYVRGLSTGGKIGLGLAAAAGAAVADATIRAGYQFARDLVTRSADSASALARNDVVGSAVAGGDTLASLMETVPVLGTAFGQLVRTVTTTVKAFDDTTRAFIERGKELSKYSPELAMSNAREFVRSLRADMREARELGGGYSALQDRYGQFQDTLMDISIDLKKAVLPLLIKGVNLIDNLATVLSLVTPGVAKMTGAASEAWFQSLDMRTKALVNGIDAIGQMVKQRKDKDAANDWTLLDKFLQDAESQFERGDVRNQRAMGGFDNAGLGLGAFGRL